MNSSYNCWSGRNLFRFKALLAGFTACIFFGNLAQAQFVVPASNHVDYNFNYDWLFLKSNPTGGASAVSYSESGWKAVSLPHTWSDDRFREWVYNSNDSNGDPLNPAGSYSGDAWYRKHFTLPVSYSGRQIILEFQGITYIAHFYVNGQLVGFNESAFGPSGIDITNYVTFGSDNVIAVDVTNNQNAPTVGYNGVPIASGSPFNVNMGGINRDVTLHITDKAHLTKPLYRNLGTQGTYIFPSNIDTLHQTATINVQAEVKNDYATSQTITCNSYVVDATGAQVLALSGGSQAIAAGQTFVFNESAAMTGVHFWDPSFPYLYQVYTVLTLNGQTVDVDQVTTGFRTYVFNPSFGLEINGHPIYLSGYAPRISMEWPAVGTPVDWMNDYDFRMIKASNANFMRAMQCAPHLEQVQAADRYGVVMVVPSDYTEDDQPDPNRWQEDLDIMRDNTIYFRNDPSVLFYEACNGEPSAVHMQQMLAIRQQWDPSGGRLAGARTNDTSTTQGIREYSGSMDGAERNKLTPLFDCEYGRTEGPRRIWDEATPEYNPKWDGGNKSNTPFNGTNTTSKYLLGGYYNVASLYHQALGFYGINEMVAPAAGGYPSGDFIGEYLTPIPNGNGGFTNNYFRTNSSEESVLENLAKHWARYAHSNFVQTSAYSAANGVNIGGAKIIWSDSWTDGRMHDMEVARTSGVVDGVRLPKEVFYGMQVAQNPNPEVYVVGHWNYPAGTVKTVYVCSNTASVDLQTFDTNGNLIKDYGAGTTAFFPASILPPGGDQVNHWVVEYTNVAFQPGSIKAIGFNSGGTAVATSQKSTAGNPDHIKLTPTTGPSGWLADGSDIAWYDVEVVDANGNRCPTYQDFVTFSCTGPGQFLGGYNDGIRYSTNLTNLTSGYSLQIESGINRVFVRSTRTAGTFTLTVNGVNNATGANFPTASMPVTSTPIIDTNGLSTVWPQKTAATLGTEPTPVAEGTAPVIIPPVSTAPPTNIVNYQYTGGNSGSTVIENVQSGQQAYVDKPWTLPTLPSYLVGGEFIQPYQADAGDSSATDQYGFNLTAYSYVYAVIDAANTMPNNDNNATYVWQLMPETITLNGRVMNFYRSRIMMPYENVLLADNGYENTTFNPASNMYLVFVVNLETQVVKPTDTVSASSTQNPNVAANGIDGNTATRWTASGGTFPQIYYLTLDQTYAVGGYDINWYNNASRTYQYLIEVSTDGTNYTAALNNESNTTEGDFQYRVPPTDTFLAKYVRITVTGGGGYASFYELKMNGIPATLLSSETPDFTSPTTLSDNAGAPVNFQVEVLNGASTYTAVGLPTGLTIGQSTGLISGTTQQTGTFSVTLTATNGAGTTTSYLTLIISGTPTDTPTLPEWALAVLAVSLLGLGSLFPRQIAPPR